MQLVIIIAVFMALLSAESAGEVFEQQLPSWLGTLDTPRSLVLMAGILIGYWSLSCLSTSLLLRRLEIQQKLGRIDYRMSARTSIINQTILLATYMIFLTAAGWTRMVIIQWQLQDYVLADEVMLLLPLVIMLTISLRASYPVNRFIRESVITSYLTEGLSARPVWSLQEYMIFNLRGHLLIILIPLLIIMGIKDLVFLMLERMYDFSLMSDSEYDRTMFIGNAISGIGTVLVFVMAPLMLRAIWKTRPLPIGPLREKLEEFCRKIKLKHRDILLWDTYSAVTNAAVMGVIPQVRFVLLSDALIENMPDNHIEGVFAHEAGHVKNHHIAFMVLMIMGMGSIAALLMEISLKAINHLCEIWSLPQWCGEASGWLIVALTAAGGFSLFGWVSRRFERQADLHAAQCLNAAAANDQQLDHNRLGPHGALMMGQALHRIAFLNGMTPTARSWRHSSIASRAEFLRELSIKDGAVKKYQRLIIMVKLAIIIALPLAGLGWWCLERVLD